MRARSEDIRPATANGLLARRGSRRHVRGAWFDRILWLNPSDNQGARFVIDAVRRKIAWTPDLG